jgi:anti-anti-sigma factor
VANVRPLDTQSWWTYSLLAFNSEGVDRSGRHGDPHAAGGEMAFDHESSLSVTVKSDGDGVLIVPQGDLDQDTVPTFECCLADALEMRRTPIRVDLSQISFIDVAAYRALMRFGDRCERRTLVNEWLNPSSSVELMFRVLGLPLGELYVDGAIESDFPPGVAARP